ncbi:MAG: ketol-acid reductoisomerase [Caldisphaera sp.]
MEKNYEDNKVKTSVGKYAESIPEIKKMTIAVIGYGNQGRSQALNLRDSGFRVVIGNIEDNYAIKAREDGFIVYSIPEAVSNSKIIFMLLPDEIQEEIFNKYIIPYLKKNHTIIFASGYNYFYNRIELPKYVNVAMIAPRMIGWGVRDMYLKNKGFPVLVAVGKDVDGKSEEEIMVLCEGLGVFKKGGCAVESSFKEETFIDLLSEHSWAGAILYLFRAYYEVATNLGASPESIILELYGSGELAEIAMSMKNIGLFEQLKTHSRTSQYGQLTRGPMYITKELRDRLYREAYDIINGKFEKEWREEQISGLDTLNNLMKMAKEHPMEKEEKKLYKILGREDENGFTQSERF